MIRYFIPSQNQIIDLETVLRAKFDKELMVTENDETGEKYDPPRIIQAELHLFTTEIDYEELIAYEGAIKGIPSVSHKILLRGDEATKLWEILLSGSWSLDEIRLKS